MQPLDLKPFSRRVRLARAWRGAALGAGGGALAGVGLVGLDAARIVFAEGWHIAALVGAGTVAGAGIGLLRRVSEEQIAASVDRRGRLRDRLTTAREGSTLAFSDELDADARDAVDGLSPRKLYPLKTGRLHVAALALAAMAGGIFILETDPALLRPSLKPKAAEAKKKAAEIERVVARALDPKEASSEELKRLAMEAKRLQKEIERDRLKPEQMMERGQKIADEAKKLAEQSAERSLKATEEAENALQKLQKAALEAKAIPVRDLEQMPTSQQDAQAKVDAAEQAAKEADQAAKDAQAKADAAQKALDAAMKKGGLSEEQKKAMENALKAAQDASAKAQEAAKQAQQALKLSKEAQEGLNALMADPAFKELQKMAAELRKNAEATKKSGDKSPTLTKEQLEEMAKRAEELGKKLRDPKFREEFLKNLREALKNAKKGECESGMCLGLGLGLGLSPMGGGGPGPDNDRMLFDTKRVNKSDKELEAKGKGNAGFVPTERGDGPGPETFVEIKGPSTVGTRTSIPMSRQIPKYRAEAESAIRSDAIPKKHHKRVREYFGGLGK